MVALSACTICVTSWILPGVSRCSQYPTVPDQDWARRLLRPLSWTFVARLFYAFPVQASGDFDLLPACMWGLCTWILAGVSPDSWAGKEHGPGSGHEIQQQRSIPALPRSYQDRWRPLAMSVPVTWRRNSLLALDSHSNSRGAIGTQWGLLSKKAGSV